VIEQEQFEWIHGAEGQMTIKNKTIVSLSFLDTQEDKTNSLPSLLDLLFHVISHACNRLIHVEAMQCKIVNHDYSIK
jgi:hypothetical protein